MRRLDAIDELGKLFREPLDSEWVVVDAEEKLEAAVHLRRRGGCRRRRAWATTRRTLL
jgi:hypothetical protein